MKNFKQFVNENNNITCVRTKKGIEAYLNDVRVGEISLYDYWVDVVYIEDINILNKIKIPINYEFMGMIESDIPGIGIATNMIKYALQTTEKNGIAISKLFIAEKAIHIIMNKLNAESITDWYILNNKNL